jgi:ABC-type multidrug transport system fused ATPase/permease subunit
MKSLIRDVFAHKGLIICVLIAMLWVSLMDATLLAGMRIFLGYLDRPLKTFWNFRVLRNYSALYQWFGVMCVLLLIRIFGEFTRQFLWFKLLRKIQHQEYLHHLQWVSGNRYFAGDSLKKWQSTFPVHLEKKQRATEAILYLAQAFIQLMVFLPILLWISWQLTFILFALASPGIYYVQKQITRLKIPFNKIRQSKSLLHTRLSMHADTIEKWNIPRDEQASIHLVQSNTQQYLKDRGSAESMQSWFYSLSEGFTYFISLTLLLIMGIAMLKYKVPVQPYLTYGLCLILAYKPVKECLRALPVLRDSAAWQVDSKPNDPKEGTTCNLLWHDNSNIMVHKLTLEFSGKTLFQNLTLNLNAKENLWITGQNGCGKTTLFRILMQRIPIHSGIVTLPQAWQINPPVFLSQEAFIPWFLPGRAQELLNSEYNLQLWNDLGLKQAKNYQGEAAHKLSGGERQRLALFFLLTSQVPMLLLDEPTSFIPFKERAHLWQVITQAAKQNNQVLWVISHDESIPINHKISLEDYAL